jgi:hypothetical protein
VLRLQRALYGLRQASRAWNTRLEAELTRKGMVQSDADPVLSILHGKGGAVLAMFYVDGGLAALTTAEQGGEALMFVIRALGEPRNYLRIHISRDRAAQTISIVHVHKALDLAAGLGLGEARKAKPMLPETCYESKLPRRGRACTW